MSSSEVCALCLAPTRSKSRLTARASRARGPLEGHVLEEMRDPRQLRPLVAAAGLDEEPGGDRIGAVVQLGDDLEPVVQRRVVESSSVLARPCGEIEHARLDAARRGEIGARLRPHGAHASAGHCSAVGPSVRIVRSRKSLNPAA